MNWISQKINTCALRDTLKRLERQPIEWKRILANCVFEKNCKIKHVFIF